MTHLPAAPEFEPEIADWLRARERDATAADTSIAGIRHHSRAVNELARARVASLPVPAHEIDVTLRAAGGPLAARIFRPSGCAGGTVVYFHGGGWIAGGIDTHLHHARRLSVESGAVVVSVDYRLAPEHRFPAAFDDCFAATCWVRENASTLGGDPQRIVVAGDSAGAQLAASVAIACRDEGIGLAAQVLIAPVIDARGGYLDDTVSARYPSRAGNDNDFGLTIAAMAEYVDLYAPGIDDWRVSPLLAATPAGLAPAIIHTAGFDVLRDEGCAYAARLRAGGVTVVHRNWSSLNHSFFGLGGVCGTADRAARTVAHDLASLLG
jgi:acetyl esterase